MGFDGFIDTVARLSHGDGSTFGSMSSLGSFLIGRQESNCALELSGSVRRMGGNMPICANALARLGVPVACVGAMGRGTVEPAFAAMHPLCTLMPVAMPGECLALEFADSKLFLADMSGPRTMTWDGIVESVGIVRLAELAGAADLLGFFNWGEIPNAQEIWQGFARDILPGLRRKARTVVFDLSDCSGRNPENILSVLSVIASYRPYARVALSANDNEIAAIARALGGETGVFMAAGALVYRCGAVDMLVHHSLGYARVFDGDAVETANGIHIENPVLVTGGGDHFNAGFCLGLLCGLAGVECAELGNTVSRLYVSTGESPQPADVLDELTASDCRDQQEEEA